MTHHPGLPRFARILVVCAHPDDESFGLGAVLHAFATRGTGIALLCFTHGEASTLHGVDGDLDAIRVAELAAAGRRLGVDPVELLEYPDGALASQPQDELAAHVLRMAREVAADGLLVFDHGGITGHPDHQAATDAAVVAADALDLPVLAWAIPATVAAALNEELGTGFVGRDDDECDIVLDVDRRTQFEAIACHTSQAIDNPVVHRRLELQQGREHLRILR